MLEKKQVQRQQLVGGGIKLSIAMMKNQDKMKEEKVKRLIKDSLADEPHQQPQRRNN